MSVLFKTGSDINFHCQFYLKIDSDVHAPIYKTNRRPHISIPPTHELSQSHFSCFTLTSQDIHSLYVIWSWLLHFSMVLICCLLQYSIYIHLIYIYIHVCLHSIFIYILVPCIQSIFNYVATFCLEEFFVHIFYVHIFLVFYRSSGMNNGPPPPQELGFHPGDEPFAPNMAIPRFPCSSYCMKYFPTSFVF